jgi:transposase
MTTKILALTDALGNLVRFVLMPGQRFDTVGVAPLIEGVAFGALIADKAFDSNAIIADLNERGAWANIKPRCRTARTCPRSAPTSTGTVIWSSVSSTKSSIIAPSPRAATNDLKTSSPE